MSQAERGSIPGEEISVGNESPETTEQAKLEALEEEVEQLLEGLRSFFYKAYQVRWERGDSYDRQHHISAEERARRSIVVPFKQDLQGEHSISLGYTVDKRRSCSYLDFSFVGQNNETLYDSFDGNLEHEYALLIDPAYRALAEEVSDQDDLINDVMPLQEEIMEASPIHERLRHFAEAYGVEIYPLLIDALQNYSWSDGALLEYLENNRMGLLTKFRDDLTDLIDKLVTNGID